MKTMVAPAADSRGTMLSFCMVLCTQDHWRRQLKSSEVNDKIKKLISKRRIDLT